MRRRILLLSLVFGLVAALAPAELGYTSLAATTTSQYVAINAGSLTVINNSASAGAAYIRVFWEGEPVTDSVGTRLAATSANAEIKAGESLEFGRKLTIQGVAIISASTSTVRLFYW